MESTTKHIQTVIDKNGRVRVQQYGKYDGYPKGQGLGILHFLQGLESFDEYERNIENINFIRDATLTKKIECFDTYEGFLKVYPEFSDATGSDLHELILKGYVPKLFKTCLKDAKVVCSGFYTIDLQNRHFITEYKGITRTYSLDYLPTDSEYLINF